MFWFAWASCNLGLLSYLQYYQQSLFLSGVLGWDIKYPLTLGVEFKCKEFKESVGILFFSPCFVAFCPSVWLHPHTEFSWLETGRWHPLPPALQLHAGVSHWLQPWTCGAQSPVIQSKAGPGRGKDQGAGTPWQLCAHRHYMQGMLTQPGSHTHCGVEGWGMSWLTGYPGAESGQLHWGWDAGSKTLRLVPLYLLAKYEYVLGKQPLAGLSIISLTLNEPVRSLSEQDLNGVGKKREKLFGTLEVEEQG